MECAIILAVGGALEMQLLLLLSPKQNICALLLQNFYGLDAIDDTDSTMSKL